MSSAHNKHIVVIAGEASGEAHAARMVTALKRIAPDITVSGIGGDNMRVAGVDIMVDFSKLAVMGLVEVIKRYRKIKHIFNDTVASLASNQPDLLVLVDYPGFNLRLAAKAKKLGIPVLYYISPKIWAWRAGRINTIKRVVDHMMVLFPFEVPLYQRALVPVTCVGHPLVDEIKATLNKEQAKNKAGFDATCRVVGLFPGSRRSEVEALLPVMVQAAEKIARHHDVSFVIPVAAGLNNALFERILAQTTLPIRLVSGNIYQLIPACDAIVAASGTVTLEIALLSVPHFIVYRASPLTYSILSRFVTIPYVGLCNIVTGKNLVTELLQNDVTATRLEHTLCQLLTRSDSQQIANHVCQQVAAALGPKGGAENAARQVIAMLKL